MHSTNTNKRGLPRVCHGGSKGFTLIEMLVVLAIIGVISAIFVRRTSLESPETKLDLAAQDLATAIRQAQVTGTSGGGGNAADVYKAMTDNSEPGSLAYGIDIKKNRSVYYLFRDIDQNGSFSSTLGDPSVQYSLPSRVTLSKVEVRGGGFAQLDYAEHVSLLFETPFITFATVSMNGTEVNASSVVLILAANGTTKKREVRINSAGVTSIKSL